MILAVGIAFFIIGIVMLAITITKYYETFQAKLTVIELVVLPVTMSAIGTGIIVLEADYRLNKPRVRYQS